MAIQSVSRAMDILSLFGPGRPLMGITEMALALDLRKATVHGLVRTLEAGGFLEQDPDSRKYALGLRIYELGIVMAGNMEINQKGAGLTQLLAGETNHMCRLGLWYNDAVIVVLNALPSESGSLSYQFGPRVPAYCTALGKAILAFLPPGELDGYLERNELVRRTPYTITDQAELRADLQETARRGYSIGNREVITAQAGLGAPIYGRGGVVLGALTLSDSAERLMADGVEERATRLLSTAAAISRAMGHYPEIHHPA